MSTDLVLLAVLMFAGHLSVARARPARARRSTACRRSRFDYLQLVGPAVLAALAAVAVMVVGRRRAARRSFHVGIEWVAVLACLGDRGVAREPAARAGRRGRDRGRRPGDRARGAARLSSTHAQRWASASISTSRLGSIRAGDLDQRRRPAGCRGRARRGPPIELAGTATCRSRTSGCARRRRSAKPASPSALSMIVEDRAAPGRRRRPDGATRRPGRRRSCRRPSTCRRRRSPGCSRRRLPRPARRDPAPATRRHRALGGRAAPGEDVRVARRSRAAARRAASSAARSSRPRGTPPGRGRCRRSVRGRRGSGRPCPAVVFASDAPPVAASFTSKPSRSATAFACSTSRPDRSSFSIGRHAPLARHVDGRVGDLGRGRELADRRLGRVEARRRSTDRTSTSSSQRSATTFGRVPPCDHADVDGHARPAAVERVQVAHDARRLEDRAAALLGLDAGVRRAAVDRDPRVERCPCATTRCRRWRGRTRGRGTRRRPRPPPGCAAVDVGEPISSSGLAMNVRRSNGSPPSSPTIALSAYSPASSPDFMSVTPGPYAMPSSMRNGRSAAVPGSNTVSMWPISRTRGAAGPSRRTCRRPSLPRRPLGIGPDVDVGAEPLEERRPSSARPRRRRRACSCRSRC